MKGNRFCKEFLPKTLDISNMRFNRVATMKSESGISPRDKHGQSTPKNKIPEHQIQFVEKHIDRIYCLQKKFLPESLNISIIYNLYRIVCEEQNETPVKEWAYCHIFNAQFNLGFHSPSSDTCRKCDKFNNLLCGRYPNSEEKKEIERKKITPLQQKKVDTERASTRMDTIVIVYILQKMLPTPRLSTNKVYYLRQLWTYNCRIHNLVTDKGHMFMWDESTAKRGSWEVGSCLVKYINSLDDEIKHVIAYTDCCAGQNLNVNIVKFWLYIVEGTNIEMMHHKFLDPGHTFNECDQDFGFIEKHKHNEMHVYVPDHWVDVVSRASKKFQVTRMCRNDCVSISNICKCTKANLKTNREGDKVE
ncbi:hypothetical protein PR048_025044 [Dryococelus australis]|uniref:Transposase n=1 Tax=Dryococelus australis TaxID=614101 RepID=A0ABQ9GQ78_9NEOP|nr:hypothetical protein PR048_025044 [Dryococelus australis]